MRTIIEMLKEISGKYGERTYLSGKTDEGWLKISFKKADTMSDEAAAWWLSRKIQRGERAALLAEGRPEWVICEIAMLKAGLVSVPLSIKLQPEEIPFRINHSESKIIVISRITLPKVLFSWEKIKKKPFLLILDTPDEKETELLKENRLKENKDWISWADMLALGMEKLKENPEAVKESIGKIKEDDTVNICYTSGTTGNPKGIMLTHLNYWSNADSAVEYFGLEEGKLETLVILPLDHSFAHTVATYAGLRRAITLSFVDARDGALSIVKNIPINLKERNPHFILTVPAITGNFMKKISEEVAKKGDFVNGIFQRGLKAGIKITGDGYNSTGFATKLRYGLSYLLAKKLVFSKTKQVFGSRILYCVGGGAILEKKQQEFYAAMGVPVYQGYGLTEAAPVISTNTPEKHKFGTSGMVMPGIECKIMKNETEEAAQGETGQIVIRGDNVMKGYFKNPEATAEVLKDGWLWTGDLGYFEEDGFLMVTGREKALLISADGEKYPPEEIEEIIAASTDVFNQIMVYNDMKKHTTALVTLDENQCRQLFSRKNIQNAGDAVNALNEEFEAWKKNIKKTGKTIPPAWRPSAFEIITKPFSEEDQLINSTMKLVRHKVVEKYSGRIEAMYKDLNTLNSRNIQAVKDIFNLE